MFLTMSQSCAESLLSSYRERQYTVVTSGSLLTDEDLTVVHRNNVQADDRSNRDFEALTGIARRPGIDWHEFFVFARLVPWF